jgi:hypothetical protein
VRGLADLDPSTIRCRSKLNTVVLSLAAETRALYRQRFVEPLPLRFRQFIHMGVSEQVDRKPDDRLRFSPAFRRVCALGMAGKRIW